MVKRGYILPFIVNQGLPRFTTVNFKLDLPWLLRSNNGGKKNWPIPRLMVKLTLAVGNPNIIHIIRFKGIDWIASRKTAARIQQTYS